MKIYLNTEIAAREVLGNLMLAITLAARGHYAILVNQEDNFVLGWFGRGLGSIFHTKSLQNAPARIEFHLSLLRRGYRLTSQDQEHGILEHDEDFMGWVSNRYCKENLEIFEKVFAWGLREQQALTLLYPGEKGKIQVTGSPRADLWGPKLSGLGAAANQRYGQYILLTPSISMNTEQRHWERSQSEPLRRNMELELEQLSTQIPFCQLALDLVESCPGHRILIRPRPGELVESWNAILGILASDDGVSDKIIISTGGDLESLIHGASVVVNSTSTAGINALISEKPLVTLKTSLSLAGKIGAIAYSVEDALSSVRRALEKPEEFIGSYRQANLEIIETRLELSSDYLAAEVIAESMVYADSLQAGKARLAFPDFLLFIWPGSVRRGLRRLKDILLLRSKLRVPPESVALLTHDEIRQKVLAISAALGLSEVPRFKVAGGRNVIIFPTNPSNRARKLGTPRRSLNLW